MTPAPSAVRAPRVLDRGSPRHRADRAAARARAGPASGLARGDAGLRPPRAAAPGRAADPVRGRGRLAVLPVGDEPARRTRGWRGQVAYIDAAHRVHARVEDRILLQGSVGLLCDVA